MPEIIIGDVRDGNGNESKQWSEQRWMLENEQTVEVSKETMRRLNSHTESSRVVIKEIVRDMLT